MNQNHAAPVMANWITYVSLFLNESKLFHLYSKLGHFFITAKTFNMVGLYGLLKLIF